MQNGPIIQIQFEKKRKERDDNDQHLVIVDDVRCCFSLFVRRRAIREGAMLSLIREFVYTNEFESVFLGSSSSSSNDRLRVARRRPPFVSFQVAPTRPQKKKKKQQKPPRTWSICIFLNKAFFFVFFFFLSVF